MDPGATPAPWSSARRSQATLGKLFCPVGGCDVVPPDRDAMVAHALYHEGRLAFDCPTCGAKFTTKRDLRHHVRAHPHGHRCSWCPAHAKTAVALMRHEQWAHRNVSEPSRRRGVEPGHAVEYPCTVITVGGIESSIPPPTTADGPHDAPIPTTSALTTTTIPITPPVFSYQDLSASGCSGGGSQVPSNVALDPTRTSPEPVSQAVTASQAL